MVSLGRTLLNNVDVNEVPKGCLPCSSSSDAGALSFVCSVGIQSGVVLGPTCVANTMNKDYWSFMEQANELIPDDDTSPTLEIPEWSKNLGWCGSDPNSVKLCQDWAKELMSELPPTGCYPCSTDSKDGNFAMTCTSLSTAIGEDCIPGTMDEAAWNNNKDGTDPEWSDKLGWCGDVDDKGSIKKCKEWASPSKGSTLHPGFIGLLPLFAVVIMFV